MHYTSINLKKVPISEAVRKIKDYSKCLKQYLVHFKLHVLGAIVFVKLRLILKMLLVACKDVIEDLIKIGSERKNLVSHMTGTLEWGSSIF